MSADVESPAPGLPALPAFRFPLVYFFYAITLFASALATFGLPGTVPALIVLMAWAIVFQSRARPKMLGRVIVVLFFCGMVTCCLLPAVQTAREASRRATCQNNLRQLAIALHLYHDDYGSFPPAYVADAQGKPMHSWRVLLLPYMEEVKLYELYKFDEPWNGPNNSLLAAKMPNLYRCPAHKPAANAPAGVTSYFAVVGPETAWHGAKGLTLADMTDGTSSTLLLVECHGASVNWLEPRDLSADEAVALLSTQDTDHGEHPSSDDFFFETSNNGRNVAFVDHSTRYVGGLSEATARFLVKRADGHPITSDDIIDAIIRYESRPNYANWFRLGGFVLIVLFPLPWVFLHPHGPRRREGS